MNDKARIAILSFFWEVWGSLPRDFLCSPFMTYGLQLRDENGLLSKGFLVSCMTVFASLMAGFLNCQLVMPRNNRTSLFFCCAKGLLAV